MDKKYDTALYYYEKALIGWEKLKVKKAISRTTANIGLTFIEKKQITEAMRYLGKAKIMAEETKHLTLLSEILQGMARCELINEKYEEALTYANEALRLGIITAHKRRVTSAYNVLYQTYKKMKKYEKSLHNYELYRINSDSLNNLDSEREIAMLQAKYEFSKKEEIIKAQNEQKLRNQRFYLYTSLGVLGAAIVIAFLIYQSRQKEHQAKELLAIKNEEISQQNEEMIVQAENLQLAYNQLRELEHFKESMLGMIVHDLKNPLNAILHQEEEKRTRTYQIANQMLGLVMNILDIQKFESANIILNIQNCYLNEIIENALVQVGFLLTDKNIRYQQHLPADLQVWTDKELMIRVFVNLLTNAIKYTPSGGKIDIHTQEVLPTQVRVFVADTGAGIPKEMQASIFERFSQINATHSGKVKSTGLGLSFCKMVINAHNNCEIKVESEIGKGSRFYFDLPVAEGVGFSSAETLHVPYSETRPITEEETNIILSFINKIKEKAIFETGDIIGILNEIAEDAPLRVREWKNALENAVYNYDEILFNKLKNI